ncbi:helix-turn-helix domain-containing protein [Parasphingopyxis sp. CP4]|uniref:cyclic nucleotide-binding domain-containing protein n=1 Tax=Parasphingopyxis sp. CP4 TaxID=2724527 RepID=UPI0015A3D728|nr:cyclic nucleotide-binding domain-containing protein [Parasphingopyxis sp. CP4]QLC22500.1 helix-turn-helix domain-containing protein [Parasphingopyxis sp. CP4]
MRPEDIPVVRNLPLFAGMDDRRFDALVEAALLQTFPPQVDLIREGDPADFLYVLVEGAVELYAGHNGRETTMAVIEPTSAFILAAVLNDAVCLMSARTFLPSRLMMIPNQHIQRCFAEDRAFAAATAAELSKAYRQLVKQHKEIKLRLAAERLANYLLRQSQARGDPTHFKLPAGKGTIAALLGMTPENLSRAFGSLSAHGVRVRGSNIHIDDGKKLADYAKPTPLIDAVEEVYDRRGVKSIGQ